MAVYVESFCGQHANALHRRNFFCPAFVASAVRHSTSYRFINPDGTVGPTPRVKEAGVKGVCPANPDELP